MRKAGRYGRKARGHPRRFGKRRKFLRRHSGGRGFRRSKLFKSGFYKRVKGVVNNMLGRQVWQSVGPGSFLSNGEAPSSNTVTLNHTASPGIPSNVLLAMTTYVASPNPDDEYFFKTARQTEYFTNTTNFPVRCRVIKLMARTDRPQLATPISQTAQILIDMQLDGPALYPEVSPTTGMQFQKLWKVLSHKIKTIGPGGHWNLNVDAHDLTRKRACPAREGNSTVWNILRGNTLIFFQFWGTPVFDKSTGQSVSTGWVTLSPVRVVHISRFFYDWRQLNQEQFRSSAQGIINSCTAVNTAGSNALTASHTTAQSAVLVGATFNLPMTGTYASTAF